jgi:hypothetical protein
MPRTWRYSGSAAVMINELVAGSAWMKPPVETWAAPVTGAVDCGDWVLPGVSGEPGEGCWAGVNVGVEPVVAPEAPPLPLPGKAARSTVARRTASAFFKCTTHMPPPALVALGRSSLAMVALMTASRAAFGARISNELLRGSASTAVLPTAATPGTEMPVPSASRCTSWAMSLATTCCNGTISISVAAGWSSAAMILAMRCRFSA